MYGNIVYIYSYTWQNFYFQKGYDWMLIEWQTRKI
nr:MAG TPA: hypothetical protein [Caudoviricetes sp.]DAZ20363.1 MAG TPA: hypothetical protein [Caudoviricetes sp.]